MFGQAWLCGACTCCACQQVRSLDPPSRLIKPPQSRRGRGESSVRIECGAPWGFPNQKVYVKRQREYFCRPIWAGFRQVPTLRRELRALRACARAGINVPTVVDYSEALETQLVLLELPQALSMDVALKSGAKPRGTLIAKIAGCIARLHAAGWVHGSLYPDHILYSLADEKIYLIDFEKARRNTLKRDSDLARLWRRYGGLSPQEQRQFDEIYHATVKCLWSQNQP